jgi:hypothetical protein
MIERENGYQPLPGQRVRSKICAHIWEQVKTAYAAGIGLREIARKMNIPEGTVLAHPKRNGWTQQIQVVTQQQSDAITPMQSVPQSIASILSERKERTKLGLSKYAAEAAERAGESDGDLRLSRNVRDVAGVHSTLWPEQPETNQILNVGILTGQVNVWSSETRIIETGPDKGQRVDLETGIIITGPSAGLPGHR